MKTIRGRFKVLELLEYKWHMKQSHKLNQQIYLHKESKKLLMFMHDSTLLTVPIRSIFK